jgi:hypothetical protein
MPQLPLVGSQTGWVGTVHWTGVPPQVPSVQTSGVVHALVSLQGVPFGAFGLEQPVAGLQTPAT